MEVYRFLKLNFIKISLFLLFSFSFIVLLPETTKARKIIKLVEKEAKKYVSEEFLIECEDSLLKQPQRGQTLSFLSNQNLRERALAGLYNNKIKAIGKENFEEFLNKILNKEEEYKESYYSFYHGQKIDFLLLQDLYEFFHTFFSKQALIDFVMLRVPDSDFEKFQTIKNFIKTYKENKELSEWNFDEKSHIKKILLSVNPSLFGNSFYAGESTFYYFMNSSNASIIDLTNLIEKMFENFNIKNLFEKYKTQITNLQKILTGTEQYSSPNYYSTSNNRTGLLLQIFIPKNLVNKISYRCQPWGKLYNEKEPYMDQTATELEDYQRKLWTIKVPSITLTDNDFDTMQFRILLNKEIMLNPNSGIKIFRYFFETENTKRYKESLNILKRDLNIDLQDLRNIS